VAIVAGPKVSPSLQPGADQANTPAIQLPDYEIIDETTTDTAIVTRVEQNILVSGDITPANLEALLRQQFESIMARRGYRFAEMAEGAYIYLFDTVEKAEAGQGLWLAMLQMGPLDEGEPLITVREELIARLGEEPEERFGLSEQTRQQVFRDNVSAQDRAMEEAMVREPTDINRQIDLERQLGEQYRNAVLEQYDLTQEELDAIRLEGLTNQWVMP
jgi:hypothetical protein